MKKKKKKGQFLVHIPCCKTRQRAKSYLIQLGEVFCVFLLRFGLFVPQFQVMAIFRSVQFLHCKMHKESVINIKEHLVLDATSVCLFPYCDKD